MADYSAIEWTDATWNPVRGCALVSPGCTNCYAMRQAHRSSGPGGAYEDLTEISKGGPVWTGRIRMVKELLDWPLHRKKPLRIFVNSMSDLFHEKVELDFIGAVFAVMAACPWHTFQILTKRARTMQIVSSNATAAWVSFSYEIITGRIAPRPFTDRWPLPNVWLGVSVEDQARADERIPLLLQTPAAVRWISAEPLLGPITLTEVRHQLAGMSFEVFDALYHKDSLNKGHPQPGLDWVVAGGESGPGARPLQLAWVRTMRDQCQAAGVPLFIKQLGRYPISTQDEGYPWSELHDDEGRPIGEWGLDGTSAKGGDPAEWPEDLRIREYPA